MFTTKKLVHNCQTKTLPHCGEAGNLVQNRNSKPDQLGKSPQDRKKNSEKNPWHKNNKSRL